MDIQHLIIFCGAQIIGLQLILSRRKFRTLPNLMLMLILFNIFTHYIYYYLFYTDKIQYLSNSIFLIISFATLAPVIVYYYVLSVIYGRLRFTKKSVLHIIPILINGFIFILFINSTNHKQSLLFMANSITISLYIIYPLIMVKTLAGFYNHKGFSLKVFNYNKKKTSLIRLLVFMMTLHFCILVVKNNLPFFIDGGEKTMDIINLCFLMLLGYAISFVIISEPKTIQLSEEKIVEAKNTLYTHLEFLKGNNDIDSLADYAYYVGKICIRCTPVRVNLDSPASGDAITQPDRIKFIGRGGKRHNDIKALVCE